MEVLHKNSPSRSLRFVSLLGGKSILNEEITSEFDLIELSNEGISKESLNELIKHLGISKKIFAENILGMSAKTLERKEMHEKLDRRTSSHIIEIAKVAAHAFEVFETEEKVQKWLNTSNKALNNMKPVDLFYIPTGLAMVDKVLGRIEEGVYS